RRHGYGEQSYVDGSRYSGDWVADKRHGFGKLTDIQEGFVIYAVIVFLVLFHSPNLIIFF
ncbi:unnamed protein product, partial [Rotaria magnacalcarata]